jgi:hypothetical protein
MRASVIGRVADKKCITSHAFARQSTTNGAARKEAALALGVIAPAEAGTSLLTTRSDSGDDVRHFAADALGDVRTAAVIQAIETRGDQPGRLFGAAGGQEQAVFGRLAVDSCAPGELTLVALPFPLGRPSAYRWWNDRSEVCHRFRRAVSVDALRLVGSTSYRRRVGRCGCECERPSASVASRAGRREHLQAQVWSDVDAAAMMARSSRSASA